MSNTLTELELAVSTIDDGATLDLIGDTLGKLDFLKEQIRLAEHDLKARLVEYIKANGEFQLGPIRYYIGPDRETKCTNLRGCVEAVLVETGGDVDAFTCLLSMNAFKPGACKKLLPLSKYSELFLTTEKTRLKQGEPEGPPQPQLQKVDQRFIR